jgi:signal transduction histidine kinase
VLGIVAGHGGGITVNSVPGMGTVVRVYLPIFDPADNDGRVAALAKIL